MTVFEILLPAFVASLILTGIHSYLGGYPARCGVDLSHLLLRWLSTASHIT